MHPKPHHLFNEKHVVAILGIGSIVVFNLKGNYGTAFLELKRKNKLHMNLNKFRIEQ